MSDVVFPKKEDCKHEHLHKVFSGLLWECDNCGSTLKTVEETETECDSQK